MKGLRLDILRYAPGQDCSAGGISSRTDHVTLVGIIDRGVTDEFTALTGGSRGPFEVTDEAPAVVLVRRKWGNGRTSFNVEPFDRPGPGRVGWMAGGTAVHGDSRFTELTFYGAVAFHDRQE